MGNFVVEIAHWNLESNLLSITMINFNLTVATEPIHERDNNNKCPTITSTTMSMFSNRNSSLERAL